MVHAKAQHASRSDKGFSLVELLLVVVIAGILTAIAVPQMIAQRRLTRSHALAREITTQLRYARQLAMSQRRAFTFQYDDTTKELKVIGPIPVGTVALADPSYPSNLGSSVALVSPLSQGGLTGAAIVYGIPAATDLPSGAPTIPTGALGDGISKTNLVNSKLNITFQPDGSVIDTSGNPVGRAMFFFNSEAAQETATAISVIGASGRVKVWRYNVDANRYVE